MREMNLRGHVRGQGPRFGSNGSCRCRRADFLALFDVHARASARCVGMGGGVGAGVHLRLLRPAAPRDSCPTTARGCAELADVLNLAPREGDAASRGARRGVQPDASECGACPRRKEDIYSRSPRSTMSRPGRSSRRRPSRRKPATAVVPEGDDTARQRQARGRARQVADRCGAGGGALTRRGGVRIPARGDGRDAARPGLPEPTRSPSTRASVVSPTTLTEMTYGLSRERCGGPVHGHLCARRRLISRIRSTGSISTGSANF